ncbi:MAG: cbb3-type cytochrome c oxidase N-terminal domain-containing protein [Flavisolibacter sp.]
MRQKIKYIAPSLLFACVCMAASAQGTKKVASNPDAWLYWTTAIVLFVIFFFLAVVLHSANSVLKKEGKGFSFNRWWATMNRRFFTQAVPVEREEDILLDHDYDGIKELDNALPPWWKYGFYFTIAVAGLYLLRYHVWKTGPDPKQEYEQEMRVASAQIEEYRKTTGDMVDEKTVTMADAAGIADGNKLFHSNCFSCHGAKGEGLVGPNLTDNYWLHGGTINDVFKTIKFGYPDKGMPSWKNMYSPTQIKELASYVKSLAGTNPPNPKAPQGDVFVESKAGSSTAKTDSTVTKK